MKLLELRPILYVTSMDETIRFYSEVLGFECVSRMESWASLRYGNCGIMISLPNEHEPFEKPHLTGSIYFNLEDVDSVWNQVKEKVTIVYPIENFDYGMREFAIRDNNGYCLNFGVQITDPSQIPENDED